MSLKHYNKDKSPKKTEKPLIEMKPFRFDSSCVHIQIDDPNDEISSDERIDSSIWQTFDSEFFKRNSSILSRTLYSIYRTRFLMPISEITINYVNILKGVKNTIFGKILITDERSNVILSDVIKSQFLKKDPIGISCKYNINYELPEELLKNYHIIYLLCINELSDKEFNNIKNNIANKESGSYTIFSTYISSENDKKRFNELSILTSVSKTTGVLQLGAFQCIDENIVIIDNNPNMNWFTEYDSSSHKKLVDSEMISRIGKRLINLFEHLGEFPVVFRYMKTFHESNKLIAETVLKGMKEIADKRSENKEHKHNSNYEFLIIDRTVDLVNPLKHSIHFRPFVCNELEKHYLNDNDLDYKKLKHFTIEKIPAIIKTLKKIEDKEKEEKNLDLIRKTKLNLKNAFESIKKCESIGFLDLLSIELTLLDSNHSSGSLEFCKKSLNERNKYLKQFIQKTEREVTNTDIIRLLIIYRLLKVDVKSDHIKDILIQKKKERQIDWTLVEDYVKLTKQVTNSRNFPQNISSIVKNFNDNKLSEEVFPILYREKNVKSEKRQLFLFVLGGLSYNDLISIPDEYQNNVIFCANGLITPRMLLNAILSKES